MRQKFGGDHIGAAPDGGAIAVRAISVREEDFIFI
jgi:hypothetical protein